MEAILQAFGRNVRAARLAKGWTQEDLSAATGLATVQISRVERGRREVRLTTLLRLRDALGVSADALLEDPRDSEVGADPALDPAVGVRHWGPPRSPPGVLPLWAVLRDWRRQQPRAGRG